MPYVGIWGIKGHMASDGDTWGYTDSCGHMELYQVDHVGSNGSSAMLMANVDCWHLHSLEFARLINPETTHFLPKEQ